MKWTANKIKALKGERKIVALTAYNYQTAKLVDSVDIPLILVGDSLANAVLGYRDTLPVTMDEMLHHTAAVARGTQKALVVADMPFMSYQSSVERGVENAGRFIKEAGADAVKIEGGVLRGELIEKLVQNGMPVLGHIGLTPQSVKAMGGYKIQGKTSLQERELMDDAMAVEQAGAFALVMECVPAEVGTRISEALGIPTIGIGAGVGCDGQILVYNDLLGLNTGRVPSFVKEYADLASITREALCNYREDVLEGRFPDDDHSFDL